MPLPFVPVWRKLPFLRILIAFIAGILLQWQLQWVLHTWCIALVTSIVLFVALLFLPLFARFRLGWIHGLSINGIFISIAAILTYSNDVRNDPCWIGHSPIVSSAFIVTLQEPLVEKTNSYKAIAIVNYLQDNSELIPATGNIILYFKKDSSVTALTYGSQIVFNKPLQAIKNSGNPGGFDYKRYCLFQGITHQVYITPKEFKVLSEKNITTYRQFLFSTRQKVLNILRRYIKGDKETGLAEALLIGYKDDLDKTLAQAYTNTGVVHIIAISGLHLSLIYGLLVLVLRPIQNINRLRWLRAFIVIAALILFSLLAGAQASVMRSAVMFTAFVIAETIDEKSSFVNTMAASAFALLCYNPFWLWDVGFQLSYAAVLSIVIFFRPVYNWLYVQNKLLDGIWKLNAVTIAAQILTIPFSLYHFHQFPNFFLLSNLLAVPLSSIILVGEILLCAVSFFPILATVIGKLLAGLLTWMNNYIESIDSLPYSVWQSIQLSMLQAILLLMVVWAFSAWLIDKKVKAVLPGLIILLLFVSLRSYSFISATKQKKIIIYNVSKHSAIDFINGRKYCFIGDSILLYDDFLQNFNLKPSRILHRVNATDDLEGLAANNNYFQFGNKKILCIGKTIAFDKTEPKIPIDIVIISKNPKLYLKDLIQTFAISQIVADGSTPYYKRTYWKKHCDSLHIPFHDVTEQGAFTLFAY